MVIKHIQHKIYFLAGLFIFLSSSEILTAQYIKYNDTFTLYYPSGSVAIKGHYKNSLPEGRWEFYHENGEIRGIENYKNGLLNDTFYKNFSGRRWNEKGSYINNLKNGGWLHDDGYGNNTCFYRNDTLQGWYKSELEDMFFVDGKAHGLYYQKSAGDTIMRGYYQNNQRSGTWILKEYFNRHSILNYKNNQLDDTSYFFADDSILYEKASYKNGELHGPRYFYNVEEEIEFYKCKNCTRIINYINGQKHGLEVVINEKGDTVVYSEYKDGKENGITYFKDTKGRVREKHWYKNGQLHYDSCIVWDSTGKLKSRELSITPIGSAGAFTKMWDAKGNLTFADSFYFKDGKEAIDIYEYKNAKLVSEMHFVGEERDGRWYEKDEYDLVYKNGKLIKTVSGFMVEDEGEYEFDFRYFSSQQSYDLQYRMATMMEFGWPMSEAPERIINDMPAAQMKYKYTNDTIQYAREYGKLKSITDGNAHSEVKIKIYVSREGTPSCATVIKKARADMDAEALRLALFTVWEPQRKEGIIIPEWKEITVVF